MTKQVQRRRGTATQHTSFTGAEGEISVNTTNKSVHVHDGVTAGGFEAARADLGNVSDASLNTALAGNTLSSLTITSADINGGTIDGTVIGGTTPAAVTGTTITGTSFVTTGDMTFGDNDKAIFGAGSDLQIYHDGSHSRISEVGTGNLKIQATDFEIINAANNEYVARFITDGAVTLYYDNAAKLATTSTGVDVTGTVTADGLTVNGDGLFDYNTAQVEIKSFNPRLTFTDDSAVGAAADKFIIQSVSGQSLGDYEFVMNNDQTSSADVTVAKFAGNGDISFYEDTGTTPKFFWDASAERLGINNTAPDGNLTVGDTSTSGDISVRIKGDATSRGFLMFGDAGGAQLGDIMYDHSTDHMRFRVNNAERMRIDSSGRVGIGTSSPASSLHINSTTGGGAIFSQAGYNYATVSTIVSSADALFGGGVIASSVAGQVTKTTGDAAHYIRAQISDGIAFHTNITGAAGISVARTTNERMRIDASGNLLVGTTVQLSAGKVCLSFSGAANQGWVSNDTGGGTGSQHLRFLSAGVNVGNISTTASSTSYSTSSDYRLKEDVQPMVGASDRVLALNPVNFAWKADGTRVDGFLAHEAQAVVPEAVHGEKDAVDADGNPVYQGIDQSKLVPLLTAALQEALTEIANLKARVAALEA